VINVLVRVPANLWRGAEAVGGRLTLTADRLYFHPHRFNIQAEPLELPVAAITSTRASRTLGVVPNGLVIETVSGERYRFVVRKRRLLIQTLADLRGANRTGPS